MSRADWMRLLSFTAAAVAVVSAGTPAAVEVACPAAAVAQHDLPCPGNIVDVPLPSLNPREPNKTGVRILPVPGTPIDPFGCAPNAEGKPELLGQAMITPFENLYTRSHGTIPPRARSRDMSQWSLSVDGDTATSKVFTLDQLKTEFPVHSRQHVMECAGNGRHGYRGYGAGANAPGNQWTIGPAGNVNWTGVLLKDVLATVGVQKSAVYVGWYSEDAPCDTPTAAGTMISRGIPIEKALDDYTMLAWEMNGETLPSYHGFPLRLVVPGYPGAAWGKWLTRLWVRNQTHDGAKMAAPAYRVPIEPVAAGSHDFKDPYWTNDNMKIITEMPVRALITSPLRCLTVASRAVALEGRAWSGAGNVTKVELSFDRGTSWVGVATLSAPVNKWAWQSWAGSVTLPSDGVWQVYARATDVTGVSQPMFAPYWNPKGYQNNAAMDLTITVKGSAHPASATI